MSLNADLAAILWRTVEVRRVSPGEPDRYNVQTDVVGDAEPVLAYFEVTAADESAGTERERRDEALLVVRPEVGLRARDFVDVGGERWIVSGEPRTLDALVAGAPHHTEATLVRLREGTSP